jgi:hypothetical protein
LVPTSSDTKLQGSELRCTLAPASVTRLDIRLGLLPAGAARLKGP